MEWKDIFPVQQQPSMENIEDYIGGEAKAVWQSLMEFLTITYKVKPKLTYSVCSGKPGWNVKFQKSGQSFGTFYPEENAFSVFMVIGYKFDPFMEDVLSKLSEETAQLYRNAGDYMKLGKWIMFRIKDKQGLEDYKHLITVKINTKTA